jgi:hypothetical protein
LCSFRNTDCSPVLTSKPSSCCTFHVTSSQDKGGKCMHTWLDQQKDESGTHANSPLKRVSLWGVCWWSESQKPTRSSKQNAVPTWTVQQNDERINACAHMRGEALSWILPVGKSSHCVSA